MSYVRIGLLLDLIGAMLVGIEVVGESNLWKINIKLWNYELSLREKLYKMRNDYIKNNEASLNRLKEAKDKKDFFEFFRIIITDNTFWGFSGRPFKLRTFISLPTIEYILFVLLPVLIILFPLNALFALQSKVDFKVIPSIGIIFIISGFAFQFFGTE